MLRYLVPVAALAVTLAPVDARADDDDSRSAVVHIATRAPVILERKIEDEESRRAGEWETACASPCDELLPIDATYRIGGAGVASSRAFHLPRAADGHVELRVDPGGEAASALAVLGVAGGAVSFIAGVVVGAGSIKTGAYSDCGNAASPDACRSATGQGFTAALALIGGGLALALVSSVALAVSGTSVDVRGAPRRDAYLRPAEFRGPGWQPPKASPAAPILSFSF